ncbi:chloroperoxidase-like protein [Moniliophthora roreri MCA 2997]|uniref:Chloroperoxidase-like protein n=2 Tax=Moniliophthora roreri TaxID=221103 RepID=V2XCW2_MONRO|nr:chloroperoxidase-like protein [Moniliophthora roreri MCA 2997]KAI3608725.1 chloroperoxidase-like protein [Moniliophthora roreri]
MDPEHQYIPPENPNETRTPCPGLNALANHGYLPRSGKSISVGLLINAIVHVYNFTYTHVFLLSFPTVLRYGKLDLGASKWRFWEWGLKIDLASLAQFGVLRIAHKASLGHPDTPSHSPDPELIQDLLTRARNNPNGGLDLHDLAAVRVARESRLSNRKLDFLHGQLAIGECGFFYLSMRNHKSSDKPDVVPEDRIKQWFGEERLPDGWWENVRPKQSVGFIETRKTASLVGKLMDSIRHS